MKQLEKEKHAAFRKELKKKSQTKTQTSPLSPNQSQTFTQPKKVLVEWKTEHTILHSWTQNFTLVLNRKPET